MARYAKILSGTVRQIITADAAFISKLRDGTPGVWVECPSYVGIGMQYADGQFGDAVPKSITRAQARAALIINGLIDHVQPAIDAIADQTQRALAQNDWDHRLHFERDNPTLLALSAALGLDDVALDDLFTQAAKL